MSLSIVHTRAALGVNAPPITVEVHISKGLPGLTMVGLPETTVKEARDRVRSAIINSGYEYPAKKITINLAPADLPKEGGRYDLPIAIALLAASEQLTANKLDEYELVGELALTGALRGVPGAIPGPGEISLAHNGVLFLDELPEFERRTLDALREPIESGQIHLSRTRAKITYPARFQLVAAMNPSPTGHYQGNHNRCTPEQTLRYLNRLSGPFLDRFDLSLEIPLPPPGILSKTVVPGESSATVKQRVMAARERQFKRQNKLNAWLDSPEIRQFCKLESEDAMWLEGTLIHLGLSIRAWQRLLKVARTIADIDQSDIITRQHLQEAVSYRAIDRLLIHLQKLLT